MKLWLAAVVFVLLPISAQAEDANVAQTVGHGQINWTQKTVTATGSGAPSLKAANVAAARLGAERAAKLDAYRNVIEALRGVRLAGSQTAGAAMDGSPALKSKVEGTVQGFKVVDTKYYSDGGVDIVIQGPVDGVLADALGKEAGQGSIVGPAEDGTTGVVINARGLGLTPALAPRLLDDAGNAVYSASLVTAEALRRNGAAAYSKSLDQAGKDPRVGAKPAVFKATRLAEAGGADLVLAGADVEKLRKLQGVLAEGRVIIVVD